MANTTFSTLKINSLKRCHHYNANDSTLLELAGSLINDIFGEIQEAIKGHPFTLDIENTVTTTASQAYVDLSDTDIIEPLNFYQRTTDSKLKQITIQEYRALLPDTTRFGGVPDTLWAPTVSVDGSGDNIWRIYLLPVPSDTFTLYYDYIKNLRFSADGTGADAEFSKLPPTYDEWIYAEFKPRFYEIIDPNNNAKINRAYNLAEIKRTKFVNVLRHPSDKTIQMGSGNDAIQSIFNRVAATPDPT